MSVDTATSLEQAVEEAFSEELQCDSKRDCRNRVVWYAISSCGCTVAPYCDPHKRMIESWDLTDGVICNHCGAPGHVRWEPKR